ncbi:MAG TPA: cytochrome c family protein [Phenylobacterium sp.]
MRHSTLLIAAACAVLSACSQGGDKAETSSAPTDTPAAAPAAPADPAAVKALLASYPAPYNTADVENGRKTFGLCRSCHSIEPGGPNMVGPNLHGVFGRKAASVADFNYSDALKASSIVWDPQTLDKWLAEPRTFLPGTKMTFAGIKDPKSRTDVIAFLMTESGYKP